MGKPKTQHWVVQIRKGGSGGNVDVIAESAEAAKVGALIGMSPGWYVLGEPWIAGTK